MLVPHLAAVVIEQVLRVAGVVEIWARARASEATCTVIPVPRTFVRISVLDRVLQ